MKFLLLSFLFSLLLDEQSMAYDQNQEFIAPPQTHHRHEHHQHHHNQQHQRQNQATPAQHRRHHHQNQNQQLQLHQALNYDNSKINKFNYTKNLNEPTTSSPNVSTTAAVRHQTHQHHQNSHSNSRSHHSHSHHHHHQHHHQDAYSSSSRAPKSIKTDAISAQNIKFAPQNNHIDASSQDLHIARATAPASSSSSTASTDYDYVDDYNYDEDSDNSAGYANSVRNFFKNDADILQMKRMHQRERELQLQHQRQRQQHLPFSDGAYRDHEYARVTRNDKTQPHNYSDYPSDGPYQELNNSNPGELTAHKIRTLGTARAVLHTRQQYLEEQERRKGPRELALDHVRRMNIATRCKLPLPRVVHVSNDTSKLYNPKAVILHRCGDDTGCCSGGQICTVKSTQNVTLYFFVLNLTSAVTIANLTLTNHTECECMDPIILMQQRAKRAPIAILNASGTLDDDDIDYETSDGEAATANAICRCPKHFDVLSEDEHQQQHRLATFPMMQQYNYGQQIATTTTTLTTHSQSTATCRCDCLNMNTPCQRLKDGVEGFPIFDRKCIDERRCALPECSFGEYNSLQGRCPATAAHRRRSVSSHNDLGNG